MTAGGSEPHVPGATGKNPSPKQDVKSRLIIAEVYLINSREAKTLSRNAIRYLSSLFVIPHLIRNPEILSVVFFLLIFLFFNQYFAREIRLTIRRAKLSHGLNPSADALFVGWGSIRHELMAEGCPTMFCFKFAASANNAYNMKRQP